MSHAFAWRSAVFASLVVAPALCLGASPAMAQSQPAGPEVRTITMSYADLDLSTAAGRTQFDKRLRRAAAEVCEDGPERRPLAELSDLRACYNHALSGARRILAQRQTENQLVRR